MPIHAGITVDMTLALVHVVTLVSTMEAVAMTTTDTAQQQLTGQKQQLYPPAGMIVDSTLAAAHATTTVTTMAIVALITTVTALQLTGLTG